MSISQKFLDVMFGDEPPLTPAELIYQRMLARDPVEVADQAGDLFEGNVTHGLLR